MELYQTICTLCGYICHQKPERSLYIAGVQLPLCARCTGIYAALIIVLIISPALYSKIIVRIRSCVSIIERKLPAISTILRPHLLSQNIVIAVFSHPRQCPKYIVIPAFLHPHLCSQAGTHLIHVPVMNRITYLTLYKALLMCIFINLITYIPVCDLNIVRLLTGSALGMVLGLIIKKALKTILIKEGQ